jgi:hypothetical protein
MKRYAHSTRSLPKNSSSAGFRSRPWVERDTWITLDPQKMAVVASIAKATIVTMISD